MSPPALTTTSLPASIPLLARGKVRDVYTIPSDNTALLFVATDRISAYDVILSNGIPQKGAVLTALSAHWFSLLGNVCRNHLVSTDVPASIPSECHDQLKGRSMVVKKLQVFPVEAIVRGYLTGSAWSEYTKTGTVHGIKVREGMRESEAFDAPMFTPSTKAEQGAHDENIHPDKVAELVGETHAKRIEELALALYTKARDYALTRGILIADTKFEFGLDAETGEVVLVDEVLTPDSSRFWLKSAYEVGKPQDSYDKQYLRDWLTREGLKGKDGVEIPADIVEGTEKKYTEVYEMLTGKKWEGVQ